MSLNHLGAHVQVVSHIRHDASRTELTQWLAEFRTATALSGDEALAAMDTDLWSFREWDAHALGSREAEDSPFS